MICKRFKEAYVKAVTLVVLERQRTTTKGKMCEVCGVSLISINNFEELKTLNITLLDIYMEYFNIFFRAEIERVTDD